MKIIKVCAVLVLVRLLAIPTVFAQRSAYWQEKPGSWLLNVGLGPTRYLGDMNERGGLAHLRLGAALGIAAAYRFSDRVTFRAEAQLYYIRGSQQDTHLASNNLSFHSLNPEIWAGVQLDFWNPDDRNHVIIPYAIAGAGITYMTPKTNYKGETYSLAPMHTEGVDYNRLPLILRYGIGVPILSGERFKWHLEGVYTHVTSDYLDDVSTVYPDRTTMNPLAAVLSDRRLELGQTPNPAGAQRGNATRRDGYFILSARLIWVVITDRQQHYRRSRRG